jgi:cell pole-organizing protein PopZ
MSALNQEPSMEEILASIKQVIADDGRAAARPSRRSRPTEVPPPEEDVLELSDPIGEPAAPLVSENAAAASRQSLAALSALRERSEGLPAGGDGPLEAVVREMLKPMLKDWLDANLPEIVEQLVAREVARITGKNL